MRTSETAETAEFLTPEEVADRLRISRPTIYRMLSSGIMPSVRVSPGALRVERAELDEWIGARRTSSDVGESSGTPRSQTPAERREPQNLRWQSSARAYAGAER